MVSLSAFGHKYSVPPAYEEIAQETGVPKKILYAVAMVESRKNHQGIYRPWPWTLNVRGEAVWRQLSWPVSRQLGWPLSCLTPA